MNVKERVFAVKISLIMASRMLGLFMLFPIMSIYAQEYSNTTPFLIGLAVGIYGLTQAFLQIPFGFLSDKFGRKTILLIGLYIFLIGSIIAAITDNIIFLIIGRAIQGGGAISAVLMAFLADFVREERRARANAFIGFQIGLTFVISIIIGPIIASHIGISGIFWTISILSILSILIVLTLPKIKPIKYHNLSKLSLKNIFNKDLIKLDFSIFSLHLILTCCFIAMPIIMIENDIVSIADNWQIYLPAILISFIGMIPLILISEKYKKTKLILLINISILIFSQFLFFKLDLNLLSFLTVISIFFIAFNTIEAILPSLLAKKAHSSQRGMLMGVFSTSQFFGTFVGGLLGGIIYQIYDLNSVFLLNIIIAIIWLFIIFTMAKK